MHFVFYTILPTVEDLRCREISLVSSSVLFPMRRSNRRQRRGLKQSRSSNQYLTLNLYPVCVCEESAELRMFTTWEVAFRRVMTVHSAAK